MRPVDSLRRRIVTAFLLFAGVSTLFFAAMAAYAVEGVEEYLVDHRLQSVADWANPRWDAGLSVQMPAGVTYHRNADIPASLRHLALGVHSVDVDGVGLHVLAGQDRTGRFAVVDHESDYEKIELVVYTMFVIAFLGFLLLSLFLGGFIARQVVNPIEALAISAQAGQPGLSQTERADELGMLARAFAEHSQALRAYLDRERYFTGDVSHELRTPLTVIIGAAEILVEQSRDQAAIQAPAMRILRAANEAAERVRVLLLLARSPNSKNKARVDLDAIVASEVQRYQTLVADKPVTLRQAAGDRLYVDGVPELCSAAIGNLIRNACQYTERGEVTVRINGHQVIVSDSGPGLPAAVRATLDDSSARVASSGSEGTGIGLSLVKRICESMGATLKFNPLSGSGSVFTIVFDGHLTEN